MQRNITNFIHKIKYGNDPYEIPITQNGEEIGNLVLIRAEMEYNEYISEKITEWRKEYNHFFQSRFEPTKERTKRWLAEVIVPDDRRLLFLVYYKDRLVGTQGYKDICDDSATGDNILIGDKNVRGPFTFLMQKTIYAWAFKELRINEINGTVLGSNPAALLPLLRIFHFQEIRRVPLIQKEGANEIVLEEDPNASDYIDVNVHVQLKRENFRRG